MMNLQWATIKKIAIAKLVVALGLLLYLSKSIYLGEKISSAEGEKTEEKKVAATESTVPAAEPEKTRKSFLENLLTLPKLNPDNVRKEEIGKYLNLAERKRAQVDERLALLEKKEKQLIEFEHSIEAKLVKLDEERKFLGQTIQQEKDLKGERLTKLIELYDKMEPKKAAPMFEKLDKDLVVALMKHLKQKQVTTILEFMNPEKSVELSEYYGRVKSMREYDLLREMNQNLKDEFQECRGMPKQAFSDKNEIQPKLAMNKPAEAPKEVQAPVAAAPSSAPPVAAAAAPAAAGWKDRSPPPAAPVAPAPTKK